MALYEMTPSDLAGRLSGLLRSQNLEIVDVDLTAARAGRGVGTCGGGPVRSALLGWRSPSALYPLAAACAKAVLLLLPALAACQWGLRVAKLYRRLGRERARAKPRSLRSGEPLLRVLRRKLMLSVTICAAVSSLVGEPRPGSRALALARKPCPP